MPIDSTQRRLIRPSLTELKEKIELKKSQAAAAEPPLVHGKPKGLPPDNTNAENFYYAKQIQNKTAMVIVFRDGEEIRGAIDWYDKVCLMLSREGEPGVLIYKSNIRYMYKAD